MTKLTIDREWLEKMIATNRQWANPERADAFDDVLAHATPAVTVEAVVDAMRDGLLLPGPDGAGAGRYAAINDVLGLVLAKARELEGKADEDAES